MNIIVEVEFLKKSANVDFLYLEKNFIIEKIFIMDEVYILIYGLLVLSPTLEI